MTSKVALNLRRFKEAVNAHDENNPPPHGPAYGIGLSYFDMDRLGFVEGEKLWPDIIIQGDGGQSATFRVLCSGSHAGEGEQLEETVRRAAGIAA